MLQSCHLVEKAMPLWCRAGARRRDCPVRAGSSYRALPRNTRPRGVRTTGHRTTPHLAGLTCSALLVSARALRLRSQSLFAESHGGRFCGLAAERSERPASRRQPMVGTAPSAHREGAPSGASSPHRPAVRLVCYDRGVSSKLPPQPFSGACRADSQREHHAAALRCSSPPVCLPSIGRESCG